MSQITTHVLDTASGKPAAGIRISLQKPMGEDQWETMASGTTNADGRVAGLMPPDKVILPGIYRMFFETKSYFDHQKIKSFYPHVAIVFETLDTGHYHVPLLLSPFGYSTYRGS